MVERRDACWGGGKASLGMSIYGSDLERSWCELEREWEEGCSTQREQREHCPDLEKDLHGFRELKEGLCGWTQ